MKSDQEVDVHDGLRAALAKLKVMECALLEVLQSFDKEKAAVVAAGIRVRINEWTLNAGPEFTQTVDEVASEQLTALLCALDDAPQLPPTVACGSA